MNAQRRLLVGLTICLLLTALSCGRGNGALEYSRVTSLTLNGEPNSQGLIQVEFEMDEAGFIYLGIPGSGPHAMVSVDRGLLLQPELGWQEAVSGSALSVGLGEPLYWLLPAETGPAQISAVSADMSQQREINITALDPGDARLSFSIEPPTATYGAASSVLLLAEVEGQQGSLGPLDSEGDPLITYRVFRGGLAGSGSVQLDPSAAEHASSSGAVWLPLLEHEGFLYDERRLLAIASWGPLHAAQIVTIRRDPPQVSE